jgi:hypothetical protein
VSFDPNQSLVPAPPVIPELSWQSPAISRGVIEDHIPDPETFAAQLEQELLSPEAFAAQLEQEIPDPEAFAAQLTAEVKNEADAEKGLSGRFQPEVAERLMQRADEQGGIGVRDAWGTLPEGYSAYMDSNPGWFHGAFYHATKAEQFMARTLIGLAAKTGIMPTEEAIDLLARDQVHSSDVINFYWQPESTAGKVGRFTTGLAADILSDPVSYLGIGALTHIGKTAVVGGKVIPNLHRMATAEQRVLRGAEALEALITKDGQVLLGAEKSSKAMGRLATVASDELPVAQKAKNLMDVIDFFPKAAQPQAQEVLQGALKNPGWVEQWRRGERGITIGVGIPFSRIGRELDVPIVTPGAQRLVLSAASIANIPAELIQVTKDGLITLSKPMPFMPKGMSHMFGAMEKGMTQGGRHLSRAWDDIWTKTGYAIFDHGQAKSFGQADATTHLLRGFEKQTRDMLKHKQHQMRPEKYNQLIDDIVDELDNGVLTTQEALASFAQQGKKPTIRAGAESGQLSPTGVLEHLTVPTVADNARMQRLSQHPEAMELIEGMRHGLSQMADEHLARGIPFNVLDNIGPGWARRYLPRKINKEFLKKQEALENGGRATEKAVREMRELGLWADKSQKGRQYRETIRDANELSMEKLGVKKYVDDPIELFVTRMNDMARNIRMHDLMESAAAHARKGKDPGIGWVEFNPEHFYRLLDKDSEFARMGMAAYVPKTFKYGQAWLPEAVYDRMLFRINGWDNTIPVGQKVLEGLGLYTKIWRNTKLFGAGYVGLNATSNMLTYAAFNGVDPGTIQSMVQATRAFMPFQKGMTFKVKGLDGKFTHINQEQLWLEAIEDGVFAGFHKELRFDRLHEHIASNRPENFNKATTVAEHAFGWTLSRWFAEKGDNIPRLATYLHKRSQGFSREFAAEAVERQFFNYSNTGRSGDVIRKAVPFSTFPLKTLELTMSELKGGALGSLTIPGKVNAQLYGAYVQDHETRDVLDSALPAYRKHISPIHGHLMAGGRQVLLEVPWLYNTLPLLMNPEENPHPLFNILQAGAYAWSARDQGLDTNPYADLDSVGVRRFLTEQINMFTPVYVRDGLAIAAMEGVFDDGGWFHDNFEGLSEWVKQHYYERYAPDLPAQRDLVNYSANMTGTHGQEIDPHYPMTGGGRVARFQNAYDFGKYLEKDWLFNWFIGSDRMAPDLEDDFNLEARGATGDNTNLEQARRVAAKGEYVRRKFRQFTLGTATISALDRTFMTNYAATRARENREKAALKNYLKEAGQMFDSGLIDNDRLDEKMLEKYENGRTIIQLRQMREAQLEYYNFFLQLEHEQPNLNPLKVIFGMNEDIIDYENLPDDFMFDQLLRTVEIPDEDVSSEIIDLYDSNYRELY